MEILAILLALIGQHQHEHDAAAGLGTVRFSISCKAESQPRFTRAVALLHSFGYEDSRTEFAEIAKSDPGCGMAQWGVAMTYYHPIWAPPAAEDYERGVSAAEAATKASAKTERERGFIAAIAAFYRDWRTVPLRQRAEAYREAMKQVHERNPKDDEATIFYALAVRALADDNDKALVEQRKAADLLLGVLPRNENHPGVAHYLIHSFDYPALAEKALAAARVYAKIAPDAPHALHMPTHIFTRLGLWDESIQANLAAKESAHRSIAKLHPGMTAGEELHASDYLIYAWLQQGKEDLVRQELASRESIASLEDLGIKSAYSLAAGPVRYALERNDWKAAAKLETPTPSFPWSQVPQAEAITVFGRSLGCARSNEIPCADSALARLGELKRNLKPGDPYDWKSQIEMQEAAAQSWLELARGHRDAALRLAREAAALEDRTEKSAVTPGSVLPARELLADMLLETGAKSAAHAEYQAVLKTSPGRRRSIEGLRAAK